MLYGDVKININSPTIKNDRFVVLDSKEKDNEKYEFIYDLKTNMEKINSFDARKILESTYNLGKMIDKFNYKDSINSQSTSDEIHFTSNIFLEASDKANYIFFAGIKHRALDFAQEHNIEIKEIHNNKDLKELFYKENRLIQKDLYNKMLEELFIKHGIQKKDINNLYKAINKWIKTCGLTEKELKFSKNQLNIFPIIIFCHKIYSIIQNEDIENLEVKINYKIKKNNENVTTELSVDTISDLVYLLTMNYFIFNKENYIFCEVCGNMATGRSSKKTCSVKCKKIRNREKRI